DRGRGMTLAAIGRRIGEADHFVNLASTVIELAKRHFEVHQSFVTLHAGGSPPPILIVDDLAGQADEMRFAALRAEAWRAEPQFQAMLAHRGPVGDEVLDRRNIVAFARRHRYTGQYAFPFLVPIAEPEGLLGIMRFGWLSPPSCGLRRDLTTLGTMVSVQCARLRLTTAPDRIARARLSARQEEVAVLAARGFTTRELGDALEISVNTVKKHLKDAFRRLDVANRAELATLLASTAPRDAIPSGITVLGDVTITTAPVRRTRRRL